MVSHTGALMQRIREVLEESIQLKQAILASPEILETVAKISDHMTSALRNGNKILFCGNGGSAADAQHLSAELTGRYYFDRPPLPAEALHVNTSFLTAVANDYSYDEVYSRAVRACGKKGDFLFALTTSGGSKNILKALSVAKELEMETVGFTGLKGTTLKDLCKYTVVIPSADTPRIQECHILLGHVICEQIEKSLFSRRSE